MQLLVFSMGPFGGSVLREVYVMFSTGQQIEWLKYKHSLSKNKTNYSSPWFILADIALLYIALGGGLQ
jgi:hypothetical protein